MKRSLIAASAIAIVIGSAMAQTKTPTPMPHPSPEATAPEQGSNSFTETQVRERLTTSGFTGISALAKDEQGVWRGRAMRDGVQIGVAVDYRGNVFQQ
jgi:hypothetical protein